jgi:predicted PurR-regulated permease PerM
MAEINRVLERATPATDESPQADAAEAPEPELPLPSDPQNVYLGGLFIFVILLSAYLARSIAMPLVLALVLKLTCQPIMRALERLRVPRLVSALSIIAVLLSTVVMLGAAVAGPAAAWLARLPQDLPKMQERLSYLREPVDTTLRFFQQVHDLGGAPPAESSAVASAEAEALSFLFSGAGGFVSAFSTTILFLFFLLLAGDGFMRRFVEILPDFGTKRRAVDIALQIENDTTAYLATITMMNVLVGFATAGVMSWLGVGDALLWGVVAFMLNFAPILGPMIGIGVFLLAGLLSSDNIWHALAPATLYLCIHLIEGQLLTPLLIARRFTINAVLIVVSLAFWFWMWGIPGAILSGPMLAILKIVCDRVRSMAALGRLMEA